MTQVCLCCGLEKPISEYEWQKNRPNPRKVCKVCRYNSRDKLKERERHKAYAKVRRQTNPEKLRQNWERSTYGVCKEDIGVEACMICGSTQRLCIDHCHNTSVVRGILCSKCNTGLGMFNDNIDALYSAIEYLRPHIQLKDGV